MPLWAWIAAYCLGWLVTYHWLSRWWDAEHCEPDIADLLISGILAALWPLACLLYLLASASTWHAEWLHCRKLRQLQARREREALEKELLG